MKPFNLEAAKRGEKVITRDGRNYEPKYFEAENIYGYTEGREMVHHLTGEYIALCPSKEDLFMAESSLPEERIAPCYIVRDEIKPPEGDIGFKSITLISTDGIHFKSEDGKTLMKITKSEQQASEITDSEIKKASEEYTLSIIGRSDFLEGIKFAREWYRNRLGEKKTDKGFTALTDPDRKFI